MILACGQCGGVVELALAGGVMGISAVITHVWNLWRKHVHCSR